MGHHSRDAYYEKVIQIKLKQIMMHIILCMELDLGLSLNKDRTRKNGRLEPRGFNTKKMLRFWEIQISLENDFFVSFFLISGWPTGPAWLHPTL